jgi:hypothetical protein
MAAHARHVATARAKAQAAAGSRESADLLAYVRQLESEVEPLAETEDRPNAILLVDSPDPLIRVAALAMIDASRELLRAVTRNTRDAVAL